MRAISGAFYQDTNKVLNISSKLLLVLKNSNVEYSSYFINEFTNHYVTSLS